MLGSKRFEGKTAFITGAASGIGRATAIAFAAEGARVVVTDRGEAALLETAERVKAAGGGVLTITCDVSKPEEVEAAWRRRSSLSAALTAHSTTLGSRIRRRRFMKSS